MLKKYSQEEINKYVIFFDNARFHKSEELKKFYNNNNLKIITNVSYESSFDIVELSFRYIKNIFIKILLFYT